MRKYKYLKVKWSDHSFLSFLGALFTSPECQILVRKDCEELSRLECDGLVHAVGWIENKLVGVVFNDFRINGGSFGTEGSLRTKTYFRLMNDASIPVVFVLNTLGVRFMDGRTVFDETFSMLPEISRFAAENLLITISIGRTLGLGAIFFGMGHYRIAIRSESLINLTGPEVINLFFGKGFDYAALASAESQFAKTNLVQELVENREEALTRAREILEGFLQQRVRINSNHLPSSFEGEHLPTDLLSNSEQKIFEIRQIFSGGSREIFTDLSPIVRTYIAEHKGTWFGVLLNPPGHTGNIINNRALEKYEAALSFFKICRLPVISFLDTSGAEPRSIGPDVNLLGKFIQVAGQIIQYPYPKMGFVVGRCFGGATILAFPKVLGGRRSYALKGSRMGVMHEDIISKLLNGSDRLLEKWQHVMSTQASDLSDLIKKGSLDEVITFDEIEQKISEFLKSTSENEDFTESLESIDLQQWQGQML